MRGKELRGRKTLATKQRDRQTKGLEKGNQGMRENIKIKVKRQGNSENEEKQIDTS